jgi:hypothetical protein
MNQLELRDIHLPEDSLWWPLAPGWWLLLVMLVMLILVTPWLYRLIRYRSMRKRVEKAFSQIKMRFEKDSDQRRLLADLSSLLRRSMMAYEGRRQTAALTGEAWVRRLTELVGVSCFSEEQQRLLSHGQYARDLQIDHDAMLESCQCWIKALPRRRPNVAV